MFHACIHLTILLLRCCSCCLPAAAAAAIRAACAAAAVSIICIIFPRKKTHGSASHGSAPQDRFEDKGGVGLVKGSDSRTAGTACAVKSRRK